MYRWVIDILLKSGAFLTCDYDGPEKCSAEVVTKLFGRKQPNDWIPLHSHTKDHITYVVIGEIAAIDIYERNDDEQ